MTIPASNLPVQSPEPATHSGSPAKSGQKTPQQMTPFSSAAKSLITPSPASAKSNDMSALSGGMLGGLLGKGLFD